MHIYPSSILGAPEGLLWKKDSLDKTQTRKHQLLIYHFHSFVLLCGSALFTLPTLSSSVSSYINWSVTLFPFPSPASVAISSGMRASLQSQMGWNARNRSSTSGSFSVTCVRETVCVYVYMHVCVYKLMNEWMNGYVCMYACVNEFLHVF